jgi:PTS system cellobiose-specific IIA component
MEISFQIILHAGNARSSAMEAMALAKEGQFAEAKEKLAEAKKELHEAHHFQTELIRAEARGETGADINVILIHAQDHLMTSIVVKDMVTEFVELYEKLAAAAA